MMTHKIGLGLTPNGSDASGPPKNSTMNLCTPLGRSLPGSPPRPRRVATQRARAVGWGSAAHHCRR
jgi:hypothetical protein